jgi:hypothetical protein
VLAAAEDGINACIIISCRLGIVLGVAGEAVGWNILSRAATLSIRALCSL